MTPWIHLLRTLVGGLFIISGTAKLFPIETFELTLVSQGITNWYFAPYLSRFLVSLEFIVGLGFLLNSFVKRIFIPLTTILLGFFSLFLGYRLITTGNDQNCGCFGDFLPMSSMEALFKNIVLLGIVVILFRKIKRDPRQRPVVPITFSVLSVLSVFLISPFKPYHVEGEKGNVSEKTPSPFGKFTSFSENVEANLDIGINLVALLSLDCDHCKEVTFDLGELWREGILPPTYVLFYGDPEKVPEFFHEAGVVFPYMILDAQTFFPLIKDHPPRVCLLKEGWIYCEWDQESFRREELERILKDEMHP